MTPANIVLGKSPSEKRYKSQKYSENEIPLSNTGFNEWREYIYRLTGVRFLENSKAVLSRRLRKRMEVLGFNSYEKYLEFARNKSNREEIFLMEIVSNAETRFFRHSVQLEAIVSSLLGELKPENQIGEEHTLRIWSAGCSTGEEVYTLAMLINEHILEKFPPVKLEIVGSDINLPAIEFADRACYDSFTITGIPNPFIRKYFQLKGNKYNVIPEIRDLVKFKFHNLNDPAMFDSAEKYDLIYCANVLMYFDKESRENAISTFFKKLKRDGKLFLGYSETLLGLNHNFTTEVKYESIYYQKNT